MRMRVPRAPLRPNSSLWMRTSFGISMRRPPSAFPDASVVPVALLLVFLDLALQGAQADAEQVRRLRAVAAGARQRFEDRLALDRLHRAPLTAVVARRRLLAARSAGTQTTTSAGLAQVSRQIVDVHDTALIG